MRRFFVEKIENNKAIIAGDEFHHLSKVLRMQEGNSLQLFCGDGFLHDAVIEKLGKHEAVCSICESNFYSSELASNISLFQAFPKGDKMEFIVQKCCELGIQNISTFQTQFCERVATEKTLAKLKKVSIEACKQCGRTSLPNLSIKKSIFDELKNFDLVIFANETEKAFPLKKAISSLPKNIAIVVGSEGGFSKPEIEKFSSLENVASVSLGRLILRCETAAIFLASVVSNEVKI